MNHQVWKGQFRSIVEPEEAHELVGSARQTPLCAEQASRLLKHRLVLGLKCSPRLSMCSLHSLCLFHLFEHAFEVGGDRHTSSQSAAYVLCSFVQHHGWKRIHMSMKISAARGTGEVTPLHPLDDAPRMKSMTAHVHGVDVIGGQGIHAYYTRLFFVCHLLSTQKATDTHEWGVTWCNVAGSLHRRRRMSSALRSLTLCFASEPHDASSRR